jgi:hypothetical protein
MPKRKGIVPTSNGPEDIAYAVGQIFNKRLGPLWLKAAQGIVPFRSGALYRALTYEVDASNPSDVTLRVGVDAGTGEDVDYGPFVERGTSRMAAQPFVVPALGQIGVLK